MSKRGEPLTAGEKHIVECIEAQGHAVKIHYDENGRRSFSTIKADGGADITLHTNAGGGSVSFRGIRL